MKRALFKIQKSFIIFELFFISIPVNTFICAGFFGINLDDYNREK